MSKDKGPTLREQNGTVIREPTDYVEISRRIYQSIDDIFTSSKKR